MSKVPSEHLDTHGSPSSDSLAPVRLPVHNLDQGPFLSSLLRVWKLLKQPLSVVSSNLQMSVSLTFFVHSSRQTMLRRFSFSSGGNLRELHSNRSYMSLIWSGASNKTVTTSLTREDLVQARFSP